MDGGGYEDIAREELRWMRKSCNLSQADLGAELGVTGQTVGMVENGRQGISFGYFVRACLILGDHPSDVMRRVEQQAMLEF